MYTVATTEIQMTDTHTIQGDLRQRRCSHMHFIYPKVTTKLEILRVASFYLCWLLTPVFKAHKNNTSCVAPPKEPSLPPHQVNRAKPLTAVRWPFKQFPVHGMTNIVIAWYNLWYCGMLRRHYRLLTCSSEPSCMITTILLSGLPTLTHWPCDTRISTISHALTPHLVYLTLKRQRQPSSQANVVHSNGRGAGSLSKATLTRKQPRKLGWCGQWSLWKLASGGGGE